MLKLKNVSKFYYQNGVIASGLTKVNLELNLGEFVVITGESGSGKSTLLNVLSGLDSYEDGEMYINGKETSHYTEEDYLEYRRKYVSNIFQNFNLVNSYTVYQNIELAMLLSGSEKKDIKSKVNELIKKVGLSKYRNTHVSKLSGGQKQRVAIARALANSTPIIVADEPTGALDSVASSAILKLLHDVAKDKLVIVVTHNKSEIEKYATRLIRMNDGKILENKVVEKIDLDDNLKAKEVKNITFLNKIRLGMRNSFNIPVKFMLMFVIYLLISITLISNYGGFKISEYEEINEGVTDYFYNDSDKRIVLKKEDNTPFNEKDYESIRKLENIDKLVENDLINDYLLNINNDYLYISGSISTENISKVSVGKVPTSSREIVIKGNKDNWYFTDMQSEILEKTFNLDEINTNEKLTIAGLIYDDSFNDYEVEFIISEELANKLMAELNKNYFTFTYKIKDKYLNSDNIFILSNDKVEENTVIINDELNGYCKNNNCLNQILELNAKNIYEDKTNIYKIAKVYKKDKLKELFGNDFIEGNVLYLNTKDYEKLLNENNYQSSVFVKDIKYLEETNKNLQNLGFNTLKIKDAKVNATEIITQVFRIFKLVVTVILILTLFFISYFIIKIIYKSRNSYYTTIRTLGGNKKVCISILRNELIILAITSYSIFLLFVYLINNNIIKFTYLKNITKYVGVIEYTICFLILILISILISYRYGRKIFKNSIIKTYGERL